MNSKCVEVEIDTKLNLVNLILKIVTYYVRETIS